MPKFEVDQYTVCTGSKGTECDIEIRCEECTDWPKDLMPRSARYRKRREADRLQKQLVRSGHKPIFSPLLSL